MKQRRSRSRAPSPEEQYLRRVYADDPRQLGRELKELRERSQRERKKNLPPAQRIEIRRKASQRDREKFERMREAARARMIERLEDELYLPPVMPHPDKAWFLHPGEVKNTLRGHFENLRALRKPLDRARSAHFDEPLERLGFVKAKTALRSQVWVDLPTGPRAAFIDMLLYHSSGARVAVLGILDPVRTDEELQLIAQACKRLHAIAAVIPTDIGDVIPKLEELLGRWKPAARADNPERKHGPAMDGSSGGQHIPTTGEPSCNGSARVEKRARLNTTPRSAANTRPVRTEPVKAPVRDQQQVQTPAVRVPVRLSDSVPAKTTPTTQALYLRDDCSAARHTTRNGSRYHKGSDPIKRFTRWITVTAAELSRKTQTVPFSNEFWAKAKSLPEERFKEWDFTSNCRRFGSVEIAELDCVRHIAPKTHDNVTKLLKRYRAARRKEEHEKAQQLLNRAKRAIKRVFTPKRVKSLQNLVQLLLSPETP